MDYYAGSPMYGVGYEFMAVGMNSFQSEKERTFADISGIVLQRADCFLHISPGIKGFNVLYNILNSFHSNMLTAPSGKFKRNQREAIILRAAFRPSEAELMIPPA